MSDNENDDIDYAGERGGDTGKSVPKGSGQGAEKGDQRREYRQHSGKTRNRADDNGNGGKDRQGDRDDRKEGPGPGQ